MNEITEETKYVSCEPEWAYMKEITKRMICDGSIAGVTVTQQGSENLEAFLASFEKIVIYLNSEEGQAREKERWG